MRAVYRDRIRLLQPSVGFGGVLLCVIWLAAFAQIETERNNLRRDIAQDAVNLALVFEQNLARTAGELDRILKYLRKSYVRSGYKADWATLIQDDYAVDRQTAQIAVIDAAGIMITSTAMLHPKTAVDLSDREHFKALARSQYDNLFISKPVVGRASGRRSVQFARRFTGADGAFAGIIVVSLDTERLAKAYKGLSLGEGGGIALVGTDDIIRAGTGIYANLIGQGLREGVRRGESEFARDGTELVLTEVDGQLRRVASRPVEAYPLNILVAARDVQNDTTWLRNRRNYIAIALCLSIMTVLAMAWTLRSRQRHEAQLIQLAHHDSLTTLANRSQFNDAVRLQLDMQSSFALHLIDLDGFKQVNDTYGHATGDTLLKLVAQRLRAVLRHCDVAARLGGDEFAVVQAGVSQSEDAGALAKRICDTLARPYAIEDKSIVIGASVGVALANKDAQAADVLLKSADLALYAAKGKGRGSFLFYDDGMNAALEARRLLQSELRLAIEHEQLVLHYQPIVDVASKRITGYEALVRWHHPTRSLIAPAEFIPLAEESGLIVPLGAWVLNEACMEIAKRSSSLRVAVNVSPTQFRSPHLISTVKDALQRSGLAPERLEIEITETTLMHRDTLSMTQLQELRQTGVHIALDDFGTGYSSLSYLQTYPIQRIKIDRSFVRTLGEKETSAPIIRAIVTLASCLGMRTVAEGVETQAQLDELAKLGCSEAQGFIFSAPKAAADLWGMAVAA